MFIPNFMSLYWETQSSGSTKLSFGINKFPGWLNKGWYFVTTYLIRRKEIQVICSLDYEMYLPWTHKFSWFGRTDARRRLCNCNLCFCQQPLRLRGEMAHIRPARQDERKVERFLARRIIQGVINIWFRRTPPNLHTSTAVSLLADSRAKLWVGLEARENGARAHQLTAGGSREISESKYLSCTWRDARARR